MRKFFLFMLLAYAVQAQAAQWGKYIYDTLNDGTPDSRYYNKVSTHTAGKLIVSGTISDVGFNVTATSFLSDGGTTEITGLGGTIYVPDAISISQNFEIGFSTPTITATLPAGTTLYYDIIGLK